MKMFYFVPDRDRQREQAKARRRRAKLESTLHPFPENGTPIQKAAHEAGGTALCFRFKKLSGPNGGCGSPTHVAGTNGGMISCGAMLTQFGKTEPYYCGACEKGGGIKFRCLFCGKEHETVGACNVCEESH